MTKRVCYDCGANTTDGRKLRHLKAACDPDRAARLAASRNDVVRRSLARRLGVPVWTASS